MSAQSELRIPADPKFIVVAKRATAGFASTAGLDVEAIDDVVIAVAQACEHAIERLGDVSSTPCGQLRIEFSVDSGRLDIQVKSVCSREQLEAARRHQAAVAEHRRRQEIAAANDLALQVMGLFVDDFGYRADERTGALRVRLTKYRVL